MSFSDLAGRIHRQDVANLKTILNGIYDYAVVRDIVQTNLARNYNTRSIKTKAGHLEQYNLFTDEDRKNFLDYLSDSMNPYDLGISFMFCTICRIGEIRALHWSDVNFQQNKILIHREIVRRECEDGAFRYVEVPHTRTGRDSGVRQLNLSPRAISILEKVLSLSEDHGKDGYIFTQEKSDQCLTMKNFNGRLKKACEAVGVQYRSSHKVRFWAASSMAANGADISILMTNSGWSDKETALHYQRRIAVGKKQMQSGIYHSTNSFCRKHFITCFFERNVAQDTTLDTT